MYFNLQVTKNGENEAVTAYKFDTVEAARANHHYFLSSSYGNHSLDYFLGAIYDVNGNVIERESWFKPPVSQPETEPETESPENEEMQE